MLVRANGESLSDIQALINSEEGGDLKNTEPEIFRDQIQF